MSHNDVDGGTSSDDDSILDGPPTFSQESTSSVPVALSGGGGSGDDGGDDVECLGTSSNTSSPASKSSRIDTPPSSHRKRGQEEEVDEEEVLRRAQRRVNVAIENGIPAAITSPSELFWHLPTERGVKKYYPCRLSTNADERVGLPLAEVKDESKKAYIQYFASGKCSLAKFHVVTKSTLVPYHGRRLAAVAEEDGGVVETESPTSSSSSTAHWCPDLCASYEAQMKKGDRRNKVDAMTAAMDRKMHMLYLEKLVELSKIKEEEARKLSQSQKKRRAQTAKTGMSSVQVDRMLSYNDAGNESSCHSSDSGNDDDSVDGPDFKRHKTETIRPGDIIEYYGPIGRHGDIDNLERAEVFSVDSKRDQVLVLSSNTHLPKDHKIRRIKKIFRGKLQDCEEGSCFQAIKDFKLKTAAKEGFGGINAGLKEEGKRVGEIVSRHMDKFEKKARADGFAPMDMMHKYKKSHNDEEGETERNEEGGGNSATGMNDGEARDTLNATKEIIARLDEPAQEVASR